MYETKVVDLYTDFDLGIEEGGRRIRSGELVAFPTETVYGLCANALMREAVSMLYAVKGRPGDNPLIVHVADRELPDRLAHVTAEAELLMEAFWPGALTIVLPKRDIIPYEVTSGLKSVALRMPDHEAALALIEEAGVPVAAPSANKSGRPSPTTAAHVLEDFRDEIPLILDGGACPFGVESTVVSLERQRPIILRPGVVTPEMIADVLGEVELSSAALSLLDEEETVLSPGMKYSHYAPKARVVMTQGEGESMARAVTAHYDAMEAAGKTCLILASEQSYAFYGSRRCVIMGNRNNPLTFCQNLYASLRLADEQGVDVVILEALPPRAEGLAYMNRALRAASFRVLRAE